MLVSFGVSFVCLMFEGWGPVISNRATKFRKLEENFGLARVYRLFNLKSVHNIIEISSNLFSCGQRQ